MLIKKSIAKRILLEFKADKRTLALLIIAPIFLITIISFLFNAQYQEFTVGYVNDTNIEINIDNSHLKEYKNENKLEQAVNKQKVDVGYQITYQDVDVSQQKLISDKMAELPDQVVSKIQKAGIDTTIQVPNFKIINNGDNPMYDTYMNQEIISSIAKNNDLVEIKDAGYSFGIYDYALVFAMEFVIVFFSFLTVGISFLREREQYTLERMLTNDINRSDIVIGYLLGYGLIAIFQSIIIEMYMIFILNIPIVGNVLVSIGVNILFALVGISLGIIISAFAKNEFQVMQFIPLVILPPLIFSGTMPYRDVYQALSTISPVTYAVDAQVNILLKGNYNIWIDVIILIVVIVIFNIITIKKLKKIRGV